MHQDEHGSVSDPVHRDEGLVSTGGISAQAHVARSDELAAVPHESVHTCLGCRSAQTVNGIRFDLLGRRELVQITQSFVDCGRSHVVHFLAVDPTVRAAGDAGYRRVLNEGDLNIADGQPIAWAVRLNGQHTARIAGTDGFGLLCDAGVPEARTHYLYGGSQQTSDRLRFQLRRRDPGISVVGAEAPPFGMPTDAELQSSAARVRASGADFLWIGIGTPNQHHVADRLRELGAAPVILCVGAAFDFMAGTKQRAPEWMQRLGLEWSHRLLSEPRRLGPRYLAGNPQFVLSVAREYLRPAEIAE
jgi:N-acetylglucosaminyldiphosphoundecaprenol N-acetyl-beta-D-mannosaminyltransferase